MKLEYTYGCICDSLCVDGIELVNLGIDRLREIIKDLVRSIWKPENDLSWLIKLILRSKGEENTFKFGPTPIYNEITTYQYYLDKNNYITLLEIPLDEILIVNEMVDPYSQTTRQWKWSHEDVNSFILEGLLKTIDGMEEYDLQEIFCNILEELGKYKDLGTCSCCGDHIDRYTLDV